MKKKDKPLILVKTKKSRARKRLDFNPENYAWLDKSQDIALRILEILEERKMKKTDLAKLLKTTRQNVWKILSGTENFSLERISKLEEKLGVELVRVSDGKKENIIPAKIKIEKDVQRSISIRYDQFGKCIINTNSVLKSYSSNRPLVAEFAYDL